MRESGERGERERKRETDRESGERVCSNDDAGIIISVVNRF